MGLTRLRIHADRTGNARATEAAVASGVLREVLLVIILRVVERRRVGNLGGDAPEARIVQPILERLARRFGGALLLGREGVDRRTVLRAGVVPLAHPLCRVVVFPEDFQHRVVRRDLWVEHDEHDLGVPSHPAAHLAICRIRRIAARVADRRRIDTRRLPELPFGAPEAAHAEHRLLEAGGKRRGEPRTRARKGVWGRARLWAPRDSRGRRWAFCFSSWPPAFPPAPGGTRCGLDKSWDRARR